jgi:hypothetical protein
MLALMLDLRSLIVPAPRILAQPLLRVDQSADHLGLPARPTRRDCNVRFTSYKRTFARPASKVAFCQEETLTDQATIAADNVLRQSLRYSEVC